AYDATHNGGNDCFLTKLGTSGTTLDYSTFLGGSSLDEGWGIAVDDNYVYLAGNTQSSAFPTLNAFDSTHNGNNDCFVTRFTSDTCSLSYSTFLGGASSDKAFAIDVLYEYAYITGETGSIDFPTADAYDSSHNGGYDCFMSKISLNGQDLISSTFLGGTAGDVGYDIVADTYYTYIVGTTFSSNFPTADAYNSTFGGVQDCFVSVFGDDSDNDGLSDFEEDQIGTDRHSIDTDTDNFLDGYEVKYGSDPLDPLSYPAMPEDWYDGIYTDLDGNTTLIQQIITWLDGNHSAIDSLFTFVEGNATLLLDTVSAVDGNSTQLNLIAALATQNADMLSALNSSHVGNVTEIREILDMLGATVGDTDYDGLDDLEELTLGTDILRIDTDNDNLIDAYEVKIGTDPLDDDSDGDTYLDGEEILAGSNPLDPLDYPGAITTLPTGIETFFIVGIGVGVLATIVVTVIMKRRNTKAS
ncbi:MAG: hypothetical protein ACW98Y_05770, partial [Candidatus Thorarchaeota archaeon]